MDHDQLAGDLNDAIALIEQLIEPSVRYIRTEDDYCFGYTCTHCHSFSAMAEGFPRCKPTCLGEQAEFFLHNVYETYDEAIA